MSVLCRGFEVGSLLLGEAIVPISELILRGACLSAQCHQSSQACFSLEIGLPLRFHPALKIRI